MFILIGARVFLADLLRRQRSPLGRAIAGPCPADRRLPDRGERARVPSWPSSSISSSSPSSSCRCWLPAAERARHRPDLVRRAARRSTCRRASCTRRSASRCSICDRWRRVPYLDRVTGKKMPAGDDRGRFTGALCRSYSSSSSWWRWSSPSRSMVMHYKSGRVAADPSKVEEQLRNLPGIEMPPPIQFDMPPVIK
jgi:hypothetical protein